MVDLPALVHFSRGVPSVYLDKESQEDILAWLTRLKTEDTIEVVTREIAEDLKEDLEFVAVLFSGGEDEDLIARMEGIDDDLRSIGIEFVQVTSIM